MKESLLSILRNKKSDPCSFRTAAAKLCSLIAAEATAFIKEKSISLQTPLATCKGSLFSEKIVLIPILRSGIALLSPFLYYFSDAKVGFLGIRRDETTVEPIIYYENLPTLSSQDHIFLLDPMVATAGSSLLAIEKILAKGGNEKNIHLTGIIGSTSGVKMIQSQHPKIQIHLTAIDKKINTKKFIVPGLGDFGDRYFGTT